MMAVGPELLVLVAHCDSRPDLLDDRF